MFDFPSVYSPIELVNTFKTNETLKRLFESRVRHYTIEEHTILVLKEFDKYFSNFNLPINLNSFRILLVLHDIGKSIAFEKGNKDLQYSYTLKIITPLRDVLPISDFDFNVIIHLLNNDSLGEYFQSKITLLQAKKIIEKNAVKSKITISEYFFLFTLYYQSDTASYTADAGGYKFLEKLFKYHANNKLIDVGKKRIIFADAYEIMYSDLEKLITHE